MPMGRCIVGGVWRSATGVVRWVTICLAAPAVAAAAYYLLVVVAALWWGRRSEGSSGPMERGVSILKPVRGRDPHFYEAIRSHVLQNYSPAEILFGVHDPNDPATQDIRRLIAEFPESGIRLIVSATKLPNAKVGILVDLMAEARYPMVLVTDADIRVAPDYLHQAVAALAQSQTGLVTCLYRARSDRWPGRWEGLGVATEFAPSVLVARLIGSGVRPRLHFAVADGRPAAHRRLPGDWRLSGRRLPARPAHHSARPARSVRASRCRNTPRRRNMGRRLASSAPLGAQHSCLASGRLLRLCGHPRHVVVPGGVCSRLLAGRRDRARFATPGRNLGRVWHLARSRRDALLLSDPAARSLGLRHLGRRIIWQHRRMAGRAPNNFFGWKNTPGPVNISPVLVTEAAIPRRLSGPSKHHCGADAGMAFACGRRTALDLRCDTRRRRGSEPRGTESGGTANGIHGRKAPAS